MSSPAADEATRRAGAILTIDLAAIAANWRGLRDAGRASGRPERKRRRDKQVILHARRIVVRANDYVRLERPSRHLRGKQRIRDFAGGRQNAGAENNR